MYDVLSTLETGKSTASFLKAEHLLYKITDGPLQYLTDLILSIAEPFETCIFSSNKYGSMTIVSHRKSKEDG